MSVPKPKLRTQTTEIETPLSGCPILSPNSPTLLRQRWSPEIVAHFTRTGLLCDEDPKKVVDRLFEDRTRRARLNYERWHRRNLEEYLCYLRLLGKKPTDIPHRDGPWWQTLRMYLDLYLPEGGKKRSKVTEGWLKSTWDRPRMYF